MSGPTFRGKSDECPSGGPDDRMRDSETRNASGEPEKTQWYNRHIGSCVGFLFGLAALAGFGVLNHFLETSMKDLAGKGDYLIWAAWSLVIFSVSVVVGIIFFCVKDSMRKDNSSPMPACKEVLREAQKREGESG